MIRPPSKRFTEACKKAEFFETDEWAAKRILQLEEFHPNIIDPCAGRGVLGKAAMEAGHENVWEFDLNTWPGQPDTVVPDVNWLETTMIDPLDFVDLKPFTVFMNPPFSLTCDFIDQSFKLGAKNVVMFQRLTFLESSKRRDFFEKRTAKRVWLCGDRATCWRGDVPDEDMTGKDGEIIKGKKGRSTPTAHAWFVFDRDHKGPTEFKLMYKD